mmetsp:Transcript_13253/g.13314  ORF Transcript_13253/g.13314 Transcript_13253/m.13314 type:complete len:267 (+) Transcript_13253:126-926(+)
MNRPGTKFAEALMQTDEEAKWIFAKSHYDTAIKITANIRKNNKLKELDNWWRKELFSVVQARSPRHITLPELEKIMRWKITRGQDRPMLIGLINQNSAKAVISASQISFQKLSQNDWKAAINALTVLRGVGPATASCVLAPFSPSLCPFMSDEVLETCTGRKREYTLKAYENMRAVLCTKATNSSKVWTNEWTAEDLGQALWAHAIISLHPEYCEEKKITKTGKDENEKKLEEMLLEPPKKRQFNEIKEEINRNSQESSRSKRKRK